MSSTDQLLQVVALYDYQANRSDELTMMRGDVIKVLYKDGPSWWFGERRSDEKQGYFPVNYVEAQGNGDQWLMQATVMESSSFSFHCKPIQADRNMIRFNAVRFEPVINVHQRPHHRLGKLRPCR